MKKGRHQRVYETLCPGDVLADDDPRRPVIIAEMKAIERAATDEDAARVVEWWGSWPNPHHQSAVEFAREARRLMTPNGLLERRANEHAKENT